jgi:hypothetical protein
MVNRMLRAVARILAPAALSAMVVLTSAPASLAQPQKVTRLTCGAYEVVPGGVAANGQPSRVGIRRAGRLLDTVSDWSIVQVECVDVHGGKTPELLVSSHSGGAHCCETLHVFALAESPRELLRYAAGNAIGYEFRDLDGDGRMELLLGDDSFAYFGDLSYAASPSYLPLVACAADRGFRDCTTRFPEIVRAALARYTGRLAPPSPDRDVKTVEGAALGVLAVSMLLAEEREGLAAVRAATGSDEVMTWLERASPQVRDWVSARGDRLKDRNR